MISRFKIALTVIVTRSPGSEQHGIALRGPFDVDVTAGQITKVAWRCDSGMRWRLKRATEFATIDDM